MASPSPSRPSGLSYSRQPQAQSLSTTTTDSSGLVATPQNTTRSNPNPVDRSSLLTFFSGQWDADAEHQIRRAVGAAERMLVHSSGYPVPPFGARWVCVADRVEDRTVFLAHRIGASHVLRGGTVEELMQEICSFALAE